MTNNAGKIVAYVPKSPYYDAGFVLDGHCFGVVSHYATTWSNGFHGHGITRFIPYNRVSCTCTLPPETRLATPMEIQKLREKVLSGQIRLEYGKWHDGDNFEGIG